jgi:hypothetical protein
MKVAFLLMLAVASLAAPQDKTVESDGDFSGCVT